jgi:hypothetical protein
MGESMPMRELATNKWISDLQFCDHLPLLQVFRVENGTFGTHGRSNNHSVID